MMMNSPPEEAPPEKQEPAKSGGALGALFGKKKSIAGAIASNA